MGEDSLSPFNIGFIEGFSNSNKDAQQQPHHVCNSSSIPPSPTIPSVALNRTEFDKGYKMGYSLGLCGSKEVRKKFEDLFRADVFKEHPEIMSTLPSASPPSTSTGKGVHSSTSSSSSSSGDN